MQTISDEGSLQLLEDTPTNILRKAYWRIGQLQWEESIIDKKLRLKNSLDLTVRNQQVESSDRAEHLRKMAYQVRHILREKEAKEERQNA